MEPKLPEAAARPTQQTELPKVREPSTYQKPLEPVPHTTALRLKRLFWLVQ